jgi:hypothetical protein
LGIGALVLDEVPLACSRDGFVGAVAVLVEVAGEGWALWGEGEVTGGALARRGSGASSS